MKLEFDNKLLFETDFYFNEQYAQLYCQERAKVNSFSFNKKKQYFANISIKSPLPDNVDLVGYDASTPYGYGGLSTNITDRDLLEKIIVEYRRFLKQEGIIAEFYRFHPFTDTAIFEHVLDFYEKERDVVYIDLRGGQEKRWEGYSTTTRNIIRKAKKNLIARESTDIDNFINLYEETMDKNKATSFYYFERDYFEKLLSLEGTKLLEIRSESETVSMGIFFFKGNLAHYHLSANNYNLGKLNGNYLLLDYASDIAFELGCDSFLLGGGRTRQEDDSLLKFKTKFSPLKKSFYIGGLISYDLKYKLASRPSDDKNELINDYFLNYRL